ncbi:serine dehydratase subunit alpha family protein [Mycoplasmatota bacterium]|nr:serine dehydratase subunit alpha family protein [Mycoplasmatota bacterium]
MNRIIKENYKSILQEELVLAIGCTEPISIAYCAAMARHILGKKPDKIKINVSGNMLKNAMGVIIPHTTSLRGVLAAGVLGTVGGNALKKLAVLEDVTDEHIEETLALLETNYAILETKDTTIKLYVEITAYKDNEYATVEIKHTHTNIVKIEKNGQIDSFTKCDDDDFNTPLITRELLNIKEIYEFATQIDLEPLIPMLKMQMDMNYAIANKGLMHDYGLNVGSTLLKYMKENDIVRKATAYTAAGSDARMSGSTMPVVTNSGSGNQGITTSVPLVIYAEYKKSKNEDLYRALILSDLIAIHIKTKLGRLSAFCGVVVAATGAACGISYLDGANERQIEDTIKNILANISGVFCDGAKPSCASKIASSVDAAFQASMLAMNNHSIESCSGIISDDIEQTIKNVGEIGYKAMNETDKKIIEIMSKSCNKNC